MTKTIIPHKCENCNCELWFTDKNKNYVYKEKKGVYWYECKACSEKKLREER